MSYVRTEAPRERLPYGGRYAELHGEAYRIWLSRDDEPAETPGFGMLDLMTLEDEDDKVGAEIAQLWRIARTTIPRMHMQVLVHRYAHDMTLDDVAKRMLITSERVRQIEIKALARLRSAVSAGREDAR